MGSLDPYGDPNWLSDFTPERVAVVARDGSVIADRSSPRSAFGGHIMSTPWDPLHRAYFNGYALWTYVTTPFVLSDPMSRCRRSLRSQPPAKPGAGCAQPSRIASRPTVATGLLLRCRWPDATSRLSRGCRRWLCRGATRFRVHRGPGISISNPATSLPARCGRLSCAGAIDGVDRHLRL